MVNSKCFNCGTHNPSQQPKTGSRPELREAECSAVLFDIVLQNDLAIPAPLGLLLQLRQQSESEFVEYCLTCKRYLKFIKYQLAEIGRIKAKVEEYKGKVQTRFIRSRSFMGSKRNTVEEEEQVQVSGGRAYDDEGQTSCKRIKIETLQEDESAGSPLQSSALPLLQPITLSPATHEHIQLKAEKIQNVGHAHAGAQNSISPSLSLTLAQTPQGQCPPLSSFGRLISNPTPTLDSNSSHLSCTTSGPVAMEIVSGGPIETTCTSAASSPTQQNSKRAEEPWIKSFKIEELQCRYCKIKLPHIHVLRGHMTLAHADQVRAKPHECKFCPERFAVEMEAVKHREIHDYDTPYECTVCAKKYRSWKSFSRHFKSSHRQK